MKKWFSAHVITASLCFATAMTSAWAGGTITGKVTLKGAAPGEKTIDMAADAVCKSMHSTAVTTRHYVAGPGGELANVFVGVKSGLEGKTFEPPKEAVVLDQQKCLYEPYVMGVQVNQDIEIVNSDDTLHNVHATPKENEEFNKGQPVKGMKFKHKFTKPETAVRFKCDVHPWMFAYVHVVPHPFFSTTKNDGVYKIENLPAGKYTIEVWHHKGGTQSQEVTVGEGETKTADFTIEPK